jgi:putative transposase
VVEKLKTMKLKKAAEKVAESVTETLTYYHFPREHQRQIRSNNMLERVMREIRRRTRVVGSFPDGRSALLLAAARLRYVAGSRWGTRRYMDMNRLKEMQEAEVATADNAAA